MNNGKLRITNNMVVNLAYEFKLDNGEVSIRTWEPNPCRF